MNTRVSTVEDVNGKTVTLTYGVVDDHAEHAFTAGQCLAFAVSIARKTGSGKVAVAFSDAIEEENFDEWEHERAFNPLDDAHDIVHHVWGVDEYDAIVDVYGVDDRGYIEDYCKSQYGSRAWFDVMSVEDAIALCEPLMTKQEYNIAESIVPVVLGRRDL